MFKFIATLFLGLFLSTSVFAKDLTNRLGIGVKENSAVSVPEIGAVYHFAPDISVAGGLGIDTQKDYSKFAIKYQGELFRGGKQ